MSSLRLPRLAVYRSASPRGQFPTLPSCHVAVREHPQQRDTALDKDSSGMATGDQTAPQLPKRSGTVLEHIPSPIARLMREDPDVAIDAFV